MAWGLLGAGRKAGPGTQGHAESEPDGEAYPSHQGDAEGEHGEEYKEVR